MFFKNIFTEQQFLEANVIKSYEIEKDEKCSKSKRNKL